MKVRLSPSMMCADVMNLEAIVHTMESERIDLLHMDVMDGHFVSNFTLGTDYIKLIRKYSKIPMDIHLMVERPEDCISWFEPKPGELFSIHAESTHHLQRALAKVREFGASPVVAINPATPLVIVEEVLPDVDGVLVMTVNPGFAGQKMVPWTLDKIRRLRTLLDEKGYQDTFIEADGNVSIENAAKMRAAGADTFVLGTSCIFKGNDIAANIRQFRSSIQ